MEQELTPKPYEDLAQLIKQTRTDQNISQRRLSAKINMSPGYTAQLESGKVQPSVKALRKLGLELGPSIRDSCLSREIYRHNKP